MRPRPIGSGPAWQAGPMSRPDVITPTAADATSRRLPLMALSAAMFTALGVLALSINTPVLTSLDKAVWNWFDVHQTPGWHLGATGAFSYIGKPFHVAAAGAVCGAILGRRAHSVWPAVLVMGGVGLGVIVEQLLKATIERVADVSAKFPDAYHHSFPSGHVTGAATLFGMVAVCLAAGSSRTRRAVLAALALTGVVTVALLALYAYAHTLTDVLGGMALGGGIVAAGAALIAGERLLVRG